MERTEGPRTPYEVYCYDCHVTFAKGTPRCIHCGRRLTPHGERPDAAIAQKLQQAEPAEPSLGRRLGGISLWVLIALGVALSRMCSER